MNLILMGIRRAKTKAECKRAGGVYRKGVRGVRKASCALPRKGTQARRSANLAGGKGVLGVIVRKGTKCGSGLKKRVFTKKSGQRVEMCVKKTS